MKKGTKRKASRKTEEEAVEADKELKSVAEETAKEEERKPKKSTEKNEEEPKKLEEKSKEEEPSKQNEKSKNEPSKAGARKAKRAKITKPVTEPEYFPDKRDLEDLWKQVFPVGTEWEVLDKVYQYKWNFTNLEDAFEEGGELYGKKVFLFACTEPQFVSFKGERSVTYIPVVVAIASPFEPSDKIGIKSVQREVEEIVPMKKMKMAWVPYIPLGNRDTQVERLKSQIFILSCTQRRAGLKHLKVDRVKNFEYCLPYFYHPFQEDELEQSTVVQIIFPAEQKPVFCEFDWELDELEEFTSKLIEEEELSEDQKDNFKEFVKGKVREAKKVNREAREARKKALEEMSEDTKSAFLNMKFYKFYPVSTPDTPDVTEVKKRAAGKNFCSSGGGVERP